jgi:hypothetical protein
MCRPQVVPAFLAEQLCGYVLQTIWKWSQNKLFSATPLQLIGFSARPAKLFATLIAK